MAVEKIDLNNYYLMVHNTTITNHVIMLNYHKLYIAVFMIIKGEL